MNGHRVTAVGIVTLAVLIAMPSITVAEAGDQRFRAGALFGIPTDELTDSGATTELDEAVGLHIAYEYFVAPKIGLEAGLAVLSHDIDITEPGFPDIGGEVDLMTFTANLNIHLLEDKSVDFYLGPTLGYAFWGDVELDVFPQDFATDDDVLYGINLGLDTSIGDSNWGFAGSVNYLFSEVSLEGGSDIGVDPLQVKLGFVYKF